MLKKESEYLYIPEDNCYLVNNMSKAENVYVNDTSVLSRFQISFEIIFIYLATAIVILAFFDSIKVALYATLAYIALFMFLSVFVVMVSYTLYNFGKVIYSLFSR